MQLSRKKTRKFLLQKLYARIYWEVNEQLFYDSYFDGILDFNIDKEYLSQMFSLIIEHQDHIIEIIKKYAPKFDIDTMLKTNILALAIAITEMLWYSEEIPAKVSINEAIDISRFYWDNTSKNIVNGILNAFFEDISTYTKDYVFPSTTYHFFSDK